MDKTSIDWNNPKSLISKHFTVKDALYLPSWEIYHSPSKEEKDNILKTVEKMELIREVLGKPIIVNCWIRPNYVNCPKSTYHGKSYNAMVGGAPKSAHIFGLAVDFRVISMTASEARTLLVTELERLGIRMENHSGSWTHIDLYPPVNKNRFFRP